MARSCRSARGERPSFPEESRLALQMITAAKRRKSATRTHRPHFDLPICLDCPLVCRWFLSLLYVSPGGFDQGKPLGSDVILGRILASVLPYAKLYLSIGEKDRYVLSPRVLSGEEPEEKEVYCL